MGHYELMWDDLHFLRRIFIIILNKKYNLIFTLYFLSLKVMEIIKKFIKVE